MDFLAICYLKSGNPKQQSAFKTLVKHRVFEKLAQFQPILTGTIPIAIDIENSDLDICCCYQSKADFISLVTEEFGAEKDFKIQKANINEEESVVANFFLDNFEIELFGQQKPSVQQNAYKHMLIEHQILKAKGEDFRQQVIALKKSGMKTEPAFAKLLGLKGNPYIELFHLLDYNKIS